MMIYLFLLKAVKSRLQKRFHCRYFPVNCVSFVRIAIIKTRLLSAALQPVFTSSKTTMGITK